MLDKANCTLKIPSYVQEMRRVKDDIRIKDKSGLMNTVKQKTNPTFVHMAAIFISASYFDLHRNISECLHHFLYKIWPNPDPPPNSSYLSFLKESFCHRGYLDVILWLSESCIVKVHLIFT